MRRISTEELRRREVINLCGGERLGYPCELEIDLDDGRVLALLVSSGGGLLFGHGEEYVIPWERIECFGEDTILVRIPKNELCFDKCSGRGGKNRRYRV